MGREVKIGLTVLSVLLLILCGVIARRIMGGGRPIAPEGPPVAANGSDSADATTLLPMPAQPTMLETSLSAGRPPLTQMAPPEAEDAWHSAGNSEPEEIDTTASFMPKPDQFESQPQTRIAARPETYAAPADRYAAPSVEVTAAPAIEATEETEPAVGVTATDEEASLSTPAPPRELLPTSDPLPAASETLPDAEEVTIAAEEPQPLPVQIAQVSSEDSYRGNPVRRTPSYTPPAASPAPTPSPATSNARYFGQVQTPQPTPAPTAAQPTPVADAYGMSSRGTSSTSMAQYGTPAPRSYVPAIAPEKEVPEVRPNTGAYYVEPGDSFWKISQKLYGTGGYFKALQEHNRARFPVPSDLQVGDEVLTPSVEVLHASYSGLCPKERSTKPGTPTVRNVSISALRGGRTYMVEEGDTLFDIAKYELGDGQRWPEIFQLNRDVLSDDIDYLKPGTQLVLPGGGEQGDILTRQPDTTLR